MDDNHLSVRFLPVMEVPGGIANQVIDFARGFDATIATAYHQDS